MVRRAAILGLAVFLAGTVSACGQEPEAEAGEVRIVEPASDQEQDAQEDSEEIPVSEPETEEAAASDQWKEEFGENCISDQTFEVELSEYSKKVCFVPFAPSGEEAEFHMQIVRDQEILTEIPGYVPEALAGQPFKSLDAVSFFDVNYDGYTDLVLIETYGDTGFAAIYYGFAQDSEEYERYFLPQEQLSEAVTRQAESLTVPAIRELLSGDRKNGSFTGWQEAYEAVSRLAELESAERVTFGLIDVDGDETPELTAGVEGYYVSLYAYAEGTVYTLMDHWFYGAMGNAGYEYAPGKNSLRNYNSDYAGAIQYLTYMEMGSRHTLDTVVQIETYNFDDINENGIPDEDEMGSLGHYGISYIDGEAVSSEVCASYDAGGYEPIHGSMSREELRQSF